MSKKPKRKIDGTFFQVRDGIAAHHPFFWREPRAGILFYHCLNKADRFFESEGCIKINKSELALELKTNRMAIHRAIEILTTHPSPQTPYLILIEDGKNGAPSTYRVRKYIQDNSQTRYEDSLPKKMKRCNTGVQVDPQTCNRSLHVEGQTCNTSVQTCNRSLQVCNTSVQVGHESVTRPSIPTRANILKEAIANKETDVQVANHYQNQRKPKVYPVKEHMIYKSFEEFKTNAIGMHFKTVHESKVDELIALMLLPDPRCECGHAHKGVACGHEHCTCIADEFKNRAPDGRYTYGMGLSDEARAEYERPSSLHPVLAEAITKNVIAQLTDRKPGEGNPPWPLAEEPDKETEPTPWKDPF